MTDSLEEDRTQGAAPEESRVGPHDWEDAWRASTACKAVRGTDRGLRIAFAEGWDARGRGIGNRLREMIQRTADAVYSVNFAGLLALADDLDPPEGQP